MKLSLSLLLALMLTWWLLSGQAQPLLLAFGLISVLLTLWLARRMDVVDRESHPLAQAGGLARFWLRLLWDIVLSNVQVVRLILAPRLQLDPQVVRVRTSQTCDLGQVVLANAITLTPGTVTLDVDGADLVIHALTRAGAEDVLAGTMDARVPRDVERLP